MSEIPDDIWEAAKATVRSFPHDWVDPLHTKAAVVARAILAERKRCADVARKHEVECEWIDGAIEARRIAAAIESGQ